MNVFIDTNVFVAYHNSDDEQHERARRLIESLLKNKRKLFTSDYVFDEAVTVALVRAKKPEIATTLGEHLIDSEVMILKVNETALRKAWEIFVKESRQKMSFTDCTNISLMRMHGMKDIAAFDRAFRKIGGIDVIDSVARA